MTSHSIQILAKAWHYLENRFDTLVLIAFFLIPSGTVFAAPVIDPTTTVAEYYGVAQPNFLLYAISALGAAIAAVGAITFAISSILFVTAKPPSPKPTCCHRH